MDYMKLADDTLIKIEEGASLQNIQHIAQDEEDALAICAVITPENITEVTFLHSGEEGVEPEETGVYTNLTFNAPTTRSDNEDGTVTVTVSFREKSELELRVDALEESQATQDGAIEDLGLAVSDLVPEEE